ncbi:MAG: hypothetical protein C0511_15345 [Hyphomicrobium sp.]|nr:hypothetical protein [Hyphomicrobium sp.]
MVDTSVIWVAIAAVVPLVSSIVVAVFYLATSTARIASLVCSVDKLDRDMRTRIEGIAQKTDDLVGRVTRLEERVQMSTAEHSLSRPQR